MTTNILPELFVAPRFTGGGRIEWTQKPVPEPGPGQLLIQVHANAICGSERWQFYEGCAVTPGHEAAGVVAAAGPGTHTAPGTAGVIFLMGFCGECRSCLSGATNQCLQKHADMGFTHDGGYGAYELVRESTFFPLAAGTDFADATLLLDIMGTGGHALRRAALVVEHLGGLLILGAGPIGLGTLAMARLLYGDQLSIWITDLIPYRLNLARKLGATPVDLNHTTLKAVLKACQAPDMVVDTTGKQAARQSGMEVLSKRGAFICVGHGEGLSVEVSRDLIAPERAVLGSEYFCYDEFAPNYVLFQQQRDYLRQIITHRVRVEEIQSAFELFFKGETGKVVVEQ